MRELFLPVPDKARPIRTHKLKVDAEGAACPTLYGALFKD
jgi:hypothetical protein